MELEKLTKTQIVLLTLFVSFITSIATGITTVTLMDQAPPGVTHTISKIVETTVERVVPEKTQGATTVKTIVVKEEDLIAQAVENNKASNLSLYLLVEGEKEEGAEENALSQGPLVAAGFVVSEDGLIATDGTLVSDDERYVAAFADGTTLPVSIAFRDEERGVALLSLEHGDTSVTPVNFANSDAAVLGKVVITLSGTDNPLVLSGIIARLDMGVRVVPKKGEGVTEGETQELPYVSAIETNLALTPTDSGGMLFDTDGKVLGMNMVREGGVSAVPSDMIKALMLTLAEQPKDETPEEEKTN